MSKIRGNRRAEETTVKLLGSEKRIFLCEGGELQNEENQREMRR